MYHLMVGYNSPPRFPLLLAFEKNFSDRDGGGLLPVCPFVPLLQVPRNSFNNKSPGLIGLQWSSCKCAGLKPGVVEAFEVELRAEEHEVVVVVILVVAYKILAEVSMQDVELVLGKELMGGRVLPMFLKLTVHERCVELVQGQAVVQTPFS